MERRYWVIVFVLGLLVIGTEALLWLVRDRTNAQTFAGPPRSDYTLSDFTLDALDSAGKRTFQVSGPRLARRGDDGSIFVDAPDYTLVDGAGHPWTGTSESAWVNKDGTIMKLLGHVEMHRAGDDKSEPVDVVTSDLTTWPKDKKMETAAAATITQPGSILRGTGLRGDLNDKTLELLSDVSSTLQSRHARDGAQ
ncbi:lipopolysaccharide export system protein LptC [Dokdonella fugitiva]|uniref:Lipopolysaccharide export system protein LptC n=1 Tax=Dokdonella fugitiva TaxID=328517 RepID=A0A839EX23_9GAMM|nr:LPS export ABC transporter periplasmic protein LptC [Dokdonella fugitiva]MBA8888325.1 lipopolysaccharide export system protein LptC [Dokdonella fugitiva]